MLSASPIDRPTAQSIPWGALMIDGDYGGFTYLLCEACRVIASDNALNQLALDLDHFYNLRLPPETSVP